MAKHTVERFMTANPVAIASDRTLAEAHRVMRERQIRHLPVIDAGRLVGVVSQRDLYLLETLHGVDPDAERVEEAMTAEPFTVAPDAPLEDVASVMAEHRYGSAVVLHGGEVVGLFTTVDALRALATVSRGARRGGAGRE
jgi:acetoin utilization protein AcuB